MQKIFVKRHPAAPAKVPVPHGLHVNGRSPYLAAEGEEMEDCVWWRRRENEGDVLVGANKADVEAQEKRINEELKAAAEKRAQKLARKAAAPTTKEAPRASKASE
jgi:hypothetical protein